MCGIGRIFILSFIGNVLCFDDNSVDLNENADISTKSYVVWPNAIVPFYIYPDHFDHEQAVSIMSSLATFAFKTCIKFVPVLAPPTPGQHVLVFQNPRGVRKCTLDTRGHPRSDPHVIQLGYDCLSAPNIFTVIMKALGFPLEHNRASRDVFIQVMFENIEPSAMELFTKEVIALPLELRSLPYDVDSVMHFGDRDHSKNGHRTIIFRDRRLETKQNRKDLTKFDLRKIEIVYGPECRKRDRQEKIELCQNYPSISRRKRDVTDTTNLRVNRDITPPPEEITKNLNDSVKELGIEDEVQNIVDDIYKVTAKALKNARIKYCNDPKPILREGDEVIKRNNTNPDILGIIETVANYAQNIVDIAVANLTSFCEESQNVEAFQRMRCNYNSNGRPCPPVYRSTKSGQVRYSTRHFPYIPQSTKHDGRPNHFVHYEPNWRAHDNETVDVINKEKVNENERADKDNTRRKRHVETNVTVKAESESHSDVTKGIKQSKPTPTVKEDNSSSKRNVKNKNSRRYFEPTRGHNDNRRWDDSSVSIEATTYMYRKRTKSTTKLFDGNESNENQRIRNKNSSPEMDNSNEDYRPTTVRLSKENVEFYNERKWPDGVVRYILKDDPRYDIDDVRRRLSKVNDILKRRTCTRIEEISEGDADRFEDYLVIDTSADYVTGRVGGRQNFGSLELYRGGQHRQHAAMMVMAMLGFYFELARHDRDQYVRVHLRHVRPDKLHHFEKIRSDATLPLEYDYASATHPAWQFWRQLGRTGISTVATFKNKDPDGAIMRSLGQNTNLLSELDLVKINSVYGTKCFKKRTLNQGRLYREDDRRYYNHNL